MNNRKTLIIVTSVAGSIIFIALTLLMVSIHYGNAEVSLRNKANAQQSVVGAVFDNTWKIIHEQAGVADQYKDAFAKIYPQLMGDRYKEGEAQLAKLVVEANPKFDTSLYLKLMTSIESQRTVLTAAQEQLIDIKREHDNLRTMRPSRWFVGSVPELKITIITSAKTKHALETGEDNELPYQK